MKFSELGLAEPVVRAVAAAGYETPTPIQAQAIPLVIAGEDLLGVAQTGTGKTAAFALPILHRLLQGTVARTATPQRPHSHERRKIRVLVLSPTRELAVQIGESFATYGRGSGLRHVVVFGGVNQFHQVKCLRGGVDILVATPGRLFDLREQGFIDLTNVEILVLDEADRMLDMGFLPSVRQIVADVPQQRQTLFFSATMPDEVGRLADSLLSNPQRVEITPVATTANRVEQLVCFVEKPQKIRLLRQLLRQEGVTRSLIFTKTKHCADKVTRMLEESDFAVEAIHSNRSQAQRQRALTNFKCGRTSVLVATDIAARGIDVDNISHVINFDLPLEVDNYVHRIGRTARAGASGIAISFCSPDEHGKLKAIERLIRKPLSVHGDLAALSTSTSSGHTRDSETRHSGDEIDRQPNATVQPRRPTTDHRPLPATANRRSFRTQHSPRDFADDFAGSGRPRRFKRPRRGSGAKRP